MPVLTNPAGAVLEVSEGTASRLGSEWVPVDQPKPKPKK